MPSAAMAMREEHARRAYIEDACIEDICIEDAYIDEWIVYAALMPRFSPLPAHRLMCVFAYESLPMSHRRAC